MKDFFNRYSYGMVKMFVNQFAISLFGSVLAMAMAATGKDILTLIVSLFAIVFYLYLIYAMTWEIGAKDKISVDVGKKEYKPFTGLFMALFANIPNFIIAIVYTVAYPLMNTAEGAGNMAAIARLASIVIQGMYLGTTSSISIGGTYMNHIWWTYFLIIVPSLVVSFVTYYLGHKDFRFFARLNQKKNNTATKS